MKKIVFVGAGLFGAALMAAGLWLWTPTPGHFDADEAIKDAGAYDARIIRDKWGVPHIYGKRDADAAFGLAYAHAEDDWKTFEEVLLFTRGRLAERNGNAAAITDYLVAALGANEAIAAKYASDLSADTQALIDGYAAGLNFYCAEKRGRCAPGIAPVTAHDVVAGFAARTPFFYGLEDELKKDIRQRRAKIRGARLAEDCLSECGAGSRTWIKRDGGCAFAIGRRRDAIDGQLAPAVYRTCRLV